MFLLLALPGLSNVFVENIFFISQMLKFIVMFPLFFRSFAILLFLLFLLPFNLGVGRSWRVKREGSVATGGIIISPKPQHYFLKNINSIWQKNFHQPFYFKRTLLLDMAIFFSVRIDWIFHCKTSTVVQNSILYNFFSLRNSSKENLLRENGKSWNCLSSHPQTFQHKNFSDVTDTNSQ